MKKTKQQQLQQQIPAAKVLNYSVYASSGYSAAYHPENIKANQPSDQASRWSSASNDLNQFLILKLDRISVLESIGFGKFHKVHVCNLKEFKVYAGPSLDSLHLILHTGLNNDTLPEIFPPDYSLSETESRAIPVQFIKIVPLAAWGSNFNFSIWYVELKGWESYFNSTNTTTAAASAVDGSSDNQLVLSCLEDYKAAKTERTTRLVLKFLRQQNHRDAFAALQASSKIQLEAPLITHLHGLLEERRFLEAEALLLQAFQEDSTIFDEFIHNHVPFQVEWNEIIDFKKDKSVLDENGDYRMTEIHGPCPRGGHQMLWDPIEEKIYLLGGWDGRRDLGDFWTFSPATQKWTLLAMEVEREGGPAARSCHKAVLHASKRKIYVLGRYIDPERRDPSNLPCDFYCYDLNTGKWERLSADVAADGGPGCIYDHQMIIDEREGLDDNASINNTSINASIGDIWVFGGRLLSQTVNEASSVYSGLYKYNLASRQWTLIHTDNPNSTAHQSENSGACLGSIRIPSRIGHSMIFDPIQRSLLVLSGQRHKDALCDFYSYAVDKQSVAQLIKHLPAVGGPEAGYTQRATFDPETRQVFVFGSAIRSTTGASNNSAPATTASATISNTANNTNGNNNTAGTSPVVVYSAALGDNCSFWCFDLKSNKWNRLDQSTSTPATPTNLPAARFAHQIVYDPVNKIHYLFGGNPGNPADPSARLDDLWSARMTKSKGPRDILRNCQYLIRCAQFERILSSTASTNTNISDQITAALQFLQNDLAAVVDHSNPSEAAAFQALTCKLFSSRNQQQAQNASNSDDELFDQIVKYFPIHMQPPQNNLLK